MTCFSAPNAPLSLHAAARACVRAPLPLRGGAAQVDGQEEVHQGGSKRNADEADVVVQLTRWEAGPCLGSRGGGQQVCVWGEGGSQGRPDGQEGTGGGGCRLAWSVQLTRWAAAQGAGGRGQSVGGWWCSARPRSPDAGCGGWDCCSGQRLHARLAAGLGRPAAAAAAPSPGLGAQVAARCVRTARCGLPLAPWRVGRPCGCRRMGRNSCTTCTIVPLLHITAGVRPAWGVSGSVY